MTPPKESALPGRTMLGCAGKTFVVAALASASVVAPALAESGGMDTGGGLTPPAAPSIAQLRCGTDGGYGCFRTYRVQPGGAVAVTGANFAAGAQVTFVGSPSPGDDVTAAATVTSPTELTAPVSDGAMSGPVVVTNPDGQASGQSRPIAIAGLPRRAGGGGPIIQAVTVSPRKFFFGAERLAALTLQVQDDGPIASSASVELFRVDTGASVRGWDLGSLPAGRPVNVKWDGTDVAGAIVPEGRYAFRLTLRDGQGRETARDTARAGSRSVRSAAKRQRKRKLGPPMGTVLFLRNAFPIQGRFDLEGFGAGGRFGAGRGGRRHQGQDVPSPCGTPLVAVESGTITWKASHPLAGNYVVLDGAGSGNDYAYMHLRDPALVEEGQTVTTGQPVGFVGQTGDARACHLHFELWQGGGWQSGGHPIDPLPFLRRLRTAA